MGTPRTSTVLAMTFGIAGTDRTRTLAVRGPDPALTEAAALDAAADIMAASVFADAAGADIELSSLERAVAQTTTVTELY